MADKTHIIYPLVQHIYQQLLDIENAMYKCVYHIFCVQPVYTTVSV